MTTRARWVARYNTARLMAAIARRRYIWHPTEHNRAELERRRRQVEYARRVLKRHPPGHDPIPAKGIDISNHNGVVDFEKVKHAGYQFVVCKAGEGDWKDPTFLHNVSAARAAGLKVGAYQFLRPRPGRTGAQEAAYFIERLNDARIGKGDIRPVLDVEATQLGKAATAEYVKDFANELRAHGFKPMTYTGTWFYGPKVGADDFGCPLWIAAYQDREPTLPKPWTEYVMWQFTDKGVVPGVSGGVDVNKTPDIRKVLA